MMPSLVEISKAMSPGQLQGLQRAASRSSSTGMGRSAMNPDMAAYAQARLKRRAVGYKFPGRVVRGESTRNAVGSNALRDQANMAGRGMPMGQGRSGPRFTRLP